MLFYLLIPFSIFFFKALVFKVIFRFISSISNMDFFFLM